MFVKVGQRQSSGPVLLVEVQKHLLFQLVLPVVDSNGVVVPVETVDKGLQARLVEVTDVGGGLPRFLAQHGSLHPDKSKSVDDNFAFD